MKVAAKRTGSCSWSSSLSLISSLPGNVSAARCHRLRQLVLVRFPLQSLLRGVHGRLLSWLTTSSSGTVARSVITSQLVDFTEDPDGLMHDNAGTDRKHRCHIRETRICCPRDGRGGGGQGRAAGLHGWHVRGRRGKAQGLLPPSGKPAAATTTPSPLPQTLP